MYACMYVCMYAFANALFKALNTLTAPHIEPPKKSFLALHTCSPSIQWRIHGGLSPIVVDLEI